MKAGLKFRGPQRNFVGNGTNVQILTEFLHFLPPLINNAPSKLGRGIFDHRLAALPPRAGKEVVMTNKILMISI